MRIAVNTRLLLPNRLDGIGWFTAETAKRMVMAHPEHQFFFLFDRRPSPQFIYAENVTPVILCPQARHPVLWYIFFEISVQRFLKHNKIDLYLSPDGMMPLHPAAPTLTVIHDLNFEHASGNLRKSHQWYMEHFFPRFAQNASRIATVSEYSKQDIAQTYGIDPSKIDVVYDGAHNNYRPHSDAEKKAIRQHFTEGKPYIIFISTILKRKNLTNLLKAFDQVKQTDTSGLKLVVVGSRVWWRDELAEAYNQMHHQADVKMIGRAEPDDLSALLSAAEMLVYPSFFEGFGIPILEAMYAETPVIASQTTSMPEVGGDAVLYIDPQNVDNIAQAIIRMQDKATQQEYIKKGRFQRTKYSWDITTNLLWGSIERTLRQT